MVGFVGALEAPVERFAREAGLRAHLDYRFRVTGNADPKSGPALTLAAGF